MFIQRKLEKIRYRAQDEEIVSLFHCEKEEQAQCTHLFRLVIFRSGGFKELHIIASI